MTREGKSRAAKSAAIGRKEGRRAALRPLPKSMQSGLSTALRERDGHIALAEKLGQFLLGQIHMSESRVGP